MGGFCSGHRGNTRFDANYPVIDEEEEEKPPGNENTVLSGDIGTHIRLQGSSKYISMFSQQGKKGVNQHAMTVWENFSGDKGMVFCAVFDGHSPSGHEVARYVRDNLPPIISSFYKRTSNGWKDDVLDIECTADKPEENPQTTNPLFLSWKARLIMDFDNTDEQLEKEKSIETYGSGTTSVCVLKKGKHLIIANLGDSRAVLCMRDENNCLVSEQLTDDLKPNVPAEADRIRRREGRVLAAEEEPDVYRIFMPHEDCPGLAMTRAFGDSSLKNFGLISTPVVTHRKLTERDEFVVLATDGIWDAISNDEAVRIVASARKRSMAAKLVVQQAVRRWGFEYPHAKVDDCTVVCLFFKRPSRLLKNSVQKSVVG